MACSYFTRPMLVISMDSIGIIYYILLYVFLHMPAFNAQDPLCQTTSNITFDKCLNSFILKWDDIRRAKPEIDTLLYPLWALSSEELGSLCGAVGQAKSACGSSPIEKCQKNNITLFVQQNLLYACDSKPGDPFKDQSDCVLAAVNKRKDCLPLLKRNSQQLLEACSRLAQYFRCVREDLRRSCGPNGVAAVSRGIDKFGCDVGKLEEKSAPPGKSDAVQTSQKTEQSFQTCSGNDWQAVTNCFQPLLNLWAEMKNKDDHLSQTAFPIFLFDRTDMLRTCDLVHNVRDNCAQPILHCPTHPLPDFVNSIAGLACGEHQTDFFIFYDCIRSAVTENPQCQKFVTGTWQPGHLKEGCGRMVPFYQCLHRPIVAKCGIDGATMLAQSIVQLGCNLNPADLVPGPIQIPETTTTRRTPSTVRLTSTSSTTLAPTTNIFPQGLSGTGQAPAAVPFFSAPIAPKPQERLLDLSHLTQSADNDKSVVVPGLNQGVQQSVAGLPSAIPTSKAGPPAQIPPDSPVQNVPTPPTKPAVDQTGAIEQTTSTTTTSTSSTTTTSTTTTTPTTTTPTTTVTTAAPGSAPVQPVPLLPQSLAKCDIARRNEARTCLQPLFNQWVSVHTRAVTNTFHSNLTFPMFHYTRQEVNQLCDLYATAFRHCPFSAFEECLLDEVVFVANAMLGYACSEQDRQQFFLHFECVSTIIRVRTKCSELINGPLLIGHDEESRCAGVRQFYECNKDQVKDTCTTGARRVLAQAIRQFGCQLNIN